MMKISVDNKWIWIGLLLIFIIGLVPYIIVFHNSSISKSISDWGSFGSYLSSVIGIINIIVLIYITYLVSTLDDKRSKSQIDAQFKITLTQFRQNEIDKLSLKLDSVFDNYGVEEKHIILYKITSTGKYLNDFVNQKLYLFPTIEDPKILNTIENIQSRYDQLIMIIDELHGNKFIETWKEEKLTTKIQFVLLQKSELIDELQKFILNDLKT